MLEKIAQNKLLKSGINKDEIDFYVNGQISIEGDVIISRFCLYFDNVSYSIKESDEGLFTFEIEYDGGFEGCKRTFTDLDVLNYHVDKMCDIACLLNKIYDVQDRLNDTKKIKRTVNLNKLI